MDMKSTLFTAIAALLMALPIAASNYITKGDGTVYTFDKLSTMANTNVFRLTGHSFTVSDTITIARGDAFRLDGDEQVRCATGFVLDIEGGASFIGQRGSMEDTDENGDTITGDSYAKASFFGDPNEYWVRDNVTHEPHPYEIRLNTDAAVTFRNVSIQSLGITIFKAGEVTIDSCSFSEHNGVSQRAAVSLAGSGLHVAITNSRFSKCRKAAIGSAANSFSNLTISGNEFDGNSTENQNIPQVNVTAGPSVLISGNKVIGDSSLNNVGGIGVGNLMMRAGDFMVTVKGNEIRDNRYGVTFTGPMSGLIEGNAIINNRYATAMTGGSGISLYYTGSDNEVVVRANDIEDNLWGVTLLGNSYYGGNNVNMGKAGAPGNNILKGNGNGGTVYALYNNQADSVWAVGNYWLDASNDSADIARVIFDHSDNASLGVVVFMPANNTTGISSPASATTATQGQVSDGIYDLSGRRMGDASVMTRDDKQLPAGVYIIRRGGKSLKVMKRG